MSVKISVSGVREIDSLLKNLPKELTHQVLGTAHAAAAKPLIRKAQLTAPEGPTGNLIDSIGVIKTPMKRAGAVGEVAVGPRRSRRHKGHHGHLIEYGFKTRAKSGGKGKKTFVTGKPFMRPSFESTKGLVIESIRVEVGKKVWATMRRYVKR